MESKLVQNAIRMDFFYGFLGRSPKLGSWSRGGVKLSILFRFPLISRPPPLQVCGEEFLSCNFTTWRVFEVRFHAKKTRREKETGKTMKQTNASQTGWLTCSGFRWSVRRRTVMEMACRAWCEHEDDDELPDDDGSPAWFCFLPLLFCESTPTNLFPPGN